MKITPEIILKHGFKKINNSMYKKDNITLQNKYIHHKSLIVAKVFKCCIDGLFYDNIEYENELEFILTHF
ncbi:MAG: hypothetical protein ACOWWH_12605 [Eubacteriaceae bacterium]